MAEGINNVHCTKSSVLNVVAGGGDGASLELGDVAEELLEAQTQSYELGLMLKLKSHVLDAIHKEESSSRKCLLKVLAEFLKQTDPQPSWRVIIDALNSRVVNLPQLGKKLEAAHFPEPTSTQDASTPGNVTRILHVLVSRSQPLSAVANNLSFVPMLP